ncbi:transcription termination/antitermination protein NusA [bacterium]|nr:transcription termination/antitermination protein NusA [bacterium]MCP5462542.1 transcription termination/antitermination protein NusA [bacterium]
MNGELLAVLEHLEREKHIDRKILIEAIESSLLSASKKRLGKGENVTVKINGETGEIVVYAIFDVVKEVTNPQEEMTLSEAKTIDSKAKIGTKIYKEITPENFGRIAAQTAKQVIIQKIREAEREIVFNEFKDKIGEIITGIIRRTERNTVIVDIGRTEALLLPREQSQNENYINGFRMRFLILDVRNAARGPEIILSRTHPSLVQKLFELEVPEIAEGTVRIKAVSREAGFRTKIAVESSLEKVDSVGACVGLRGERVKNIVHELNGEKIDIVRYSDNISQFVENALSPAKVATIKLDKEHKSMVVLVEADQFSLAIGKKGQNARLTARLTGWHIDIKKKGEELLTTQYTDENDKLPTIPGIKPKIFETLIEAGYNTLHTLQTLDIESLKNLKGIGEKTAPQILESIQTYVRKEQSKTKLDSILAQKSKELQKE